LPKCEKGHDMGFEARCSLCGSPISYRLSIEELKEVQLPGRPREETMAILVDMRAGLQIEYTAPRGVYVLNISLGDNTATSEGSAVFRRLRGRLWPEYYKEYGELFEWILKIHCAGCAPSKVILANTASPLSPLALASQPVDPSSSIAIATIPAEDAPTPEGFNSYSSLKIIDRRGIPAILVTEGFARELSGYSEELGYIDYWDAVAYLSKLIVASSEGVLRAVSEDREMGIRVYCIAAIIGGSGSIFKTVLHALKSLLYRASLDIRDGDIQSIHLIAASPRELAKDIEESYRDYIKGFAGLLNHSIHILERQSRLGSYDLIAMVGLRGKVEFEWLTRSYESVRGRNPELDVDRILGGWP